MKTRSYQLVMGLEIPAGVQFMFIRDYTSRPGRRQGHTFTFTQGKSMSAVPGVPSIIGQFIQVNLDECSGSTRPIIEDSTEM